MTTHCAQRSKSYCPYCTKTKTLFAQQFPGVSVQVHELDVLSNGAALQDQLQHMTGQRSVPNVFVKNQHVGGNDDTQAAYQAGNLQKMLG